MKTGGRKIRMIYEVSDLTLDLDRHLLTRGGQPIKLTRLSFKVLQVLVQAAQAEPERRMSVQRAAIEKMAAGE